MEKKQKIRVIVVDDQEEMINGLELYFRHSKNIILTGKARSGEESVALVQQRPSDVVLMDIKMESRRAGMIAAEQILLQKKPSPKIVFLTAYPEKSDIEKALKMGCSFVDKSCSIPRIIEIIEDFFYNDNIVVETC